MAEPFSQTLISFEDAHVLVIDDDIENYHLLKHILANGGIESCAYSATIDDAFTALETQLPHIILLDIMMPDISGFDFCAQIKRSSVFSHIPVIFISALKGADIRAKAFSLGGVDYLQKPYDKDEVLARIKVHLQNGLLLENLATQANVMQAEMELGARVQRSLLPDPVKITALSQKHGFELASAFAPCGTLAGDFWQLLEVSDNTFAIAVCDYSGHGVASALETARFHSLLYELKPLWQTPEKFFAALNKRMYAMLPPEIFATFSYVLVNTKTREARYLNAGGPPLFRFTSSGAPEVYKIPAPPLGALPHWPDKTATEITLQGGDGLLLCSDALSELHLKAPDHTPLDEQNLAALNSPPLDAESIKETLLTAFNAAPPKARNDDLTLLSIVF